MPKLVLTIAQQSADARPVRRCGNENPNRYHRVVGHRTAPSDAMQAALDAVGAFIDAPSYKRRQMIGGSK